MVWSFEIDPEARHRAFDTWLLARKIAELLDPPVVPNGEPLDEKPGVLAESRWLVSSA